MSQVCDVSIREGRSEDLDQMNRVVEHAVMSWQLPDRVKRLAIPSYRYHDYDMSNMTFFLAEDASNQVRGLAALEQIIAPGASDARAMLLHGLYVDPECHGQGVGKQLLACAEIFAHDQGFTGMLVKAQPEAASFFVKKGYEELEVEDMRKDYQHRLWKSFKV
jgi:N-acetylglutamate synthase-like GNAT family acetyltransferase